MDILIYCRMRGSKSRGFFTLFLLLLLHNEGSATTESKVVKNETIVYRLPNVTIPVSYEIKLIPEIVEGNFTFYGETKIAVKVLKETSNVTLHSKDLRIDENYTSLVDNKGVVMKAKKHLYFNATNFLVIEFDKPIAVGNYTLSFKFAGNMTNVPEGIYNSSYINEKGEKVYVKNNSFEKLIIS